MRSGLAAQADLASEFGSRFREADGRMTHRERLATHGEADRLHGRAEQSGSEPVTTESMEWRREPNAAGQQAAG